MASLMVSMHGNIAEIVEEQAGVSLVIEGQVATGVRLLIPLVLGSFALLEYRIRTPDCCKYLCLVYCYKFIASVKYKLL